MRLVWPQALWLLLALPCLVGAYVAAWRRKRSALRYSSIQLVREAMSVGNRFRPHIPALLFLVALALSVVAIARPAVMITTPSHERTVILAVDVSLSMAQEDVKPSRLAAAQAAARSFIASQPDGARIGVVAFAAYAYLVQPPTTDRAQAIAAIDHLQLQYHTAIGAGLIAALLTIFPDDRFAENYDIFGDGIRPVAGDPLHLDRDFARDALLGARWKPGSHPSAAIVLLTDGRDTTGPSGDMAAKFAAERGVRVYTVGFGKADTAPMADGGATDTDFDEAMLKRIAASTRGEYFPAATAKELQKIYHNLQGRIVLRKTGMELSAFFAGAAALLLMVSGVLSLAWCGGIVSARRAQRTPGNAG
ncbi:MAG: VWA domain-containing protein [Burkholderiales bacterium]|nr:VWA domain-containing protein [Burkholderiales bacterium]